MDDDPCRRARMKTAPDRKSGSARHGQLRQQGERLKRAWTEILQEQEFGEIVQIAFVRDGEHGSETFQIDILRAHFMMRRQAQVARRIAESFPDFRARSRAARFAPASLEHRRDS